MNKSEIIKSFELSAAAYKEIQPYCPHDCVSVINNPELDVECFLRRENKTLRVTFRGSASSENWKNDFEFWEKNIPYDHISRDIKVHAGFLNSYKAAGIRDKILAAIDENTKYIKICGHSLGAALSVLCAFDVAYNFPDRDIEVIVFGCPRVGNKAFAKLYNKLVTKSIRVENGNDIVTKIPFRFSNPFLNYRHVGATLRIGSVRLPFVASVRDHMPKNYYSALLTRLL